MTNARFQADAHPRERRDAGAPPGTRRLPRRPAGAARPRQAPAPRAGSSRKDPALPKRYLAQIESGQGNPSVIILKSIADALDVPIIELLPRMNGRSAAAKHVLDLIARLPSSRLPAVAELIESRAERITPATARRIGLVGLRGAGKSTLGKMLAHALGCPFIELDRLVEQERGARIPDLIEMAGLATFRRYHERACLGRVIDEHAAAVIATAGGIVSNAETALLLRRTHAVWIKRGQEAYEPGDGAGRLPPDGARSRGDDRPGRDPRGARRRLCAARRPRSIPRVIGEAEFRETPSDRDALYGRA